MNIGKYFYIRRGNAFKIYMRIDGGAELVPTEDTYSFAEEARKRVYELNGWKNYKPKF